MTSRRIFSTGNAVTEEKSRDTGSDLLAVGVIKGAHGVRGELRLLSFTENPADLLAFSPFLNTDGEAWLTIISSRNKGKEWIVKAQEVTEREQAMALKSTLLFTHRAQLRSLDHPAEYYHSDLLGLAVQDLDGTRIGEVKAVHNFGASDILEIMDSQTNTSRMIPFTEKDVPSIDLDAGIVTIMTESLS